MRAKRQVLPPGQAHVRVKGAGHREPKALPAAQAQEVLRSLSGLTSEAREEKGAPSGAPEPGIETPSH